MLDTEEYRSWLESRRLIVSQLTVTEAAIRDLGARIDGYNEVSREKTLEIANHADAGIAELRMHVAARELLAQVWSGAIGLLTGGAATAIVQLLMYHFR